MTTAGASGGFEAGIEAALQRILASPQFLFRIERDPAGGVAHQAHRQRRRTGFAAVVLSVEQHSRRPVAQDRQRRET